MEKQRKKQLIVAEDLRGRVKELGDLYRML